MKNIKKILIILFLQLVVAVLLLPLFVKPKNIIAEEKNLPAYYSILDDYYLLNKNQGSMGLCWDFAATRSLETLFAKQLNEYISFSEAGFSFYNREIGDGGQFRTHYYSLIKQSEEPLDRKNGFVYFENQFPYELLFYANGKTNSDNGTSKTINNYLDPLKLKDLGEMVEPIDVDSNYSGDNKIIKRIKELIYENSSVYYEINHYIYKENPLYEKKTIYLEAKYPSALEQHAISLVGFDDNYKSKTNGITSQGAFIALNSNSFHTGDSILYVPYEYVKMLPSQYEVASYKFLNKKYQITSTRTSDKRIKNNHANTYNSQQNFAAQAKQFKNNNLFKTNEPIDITYHLPQDFSNVSIKIYDGTIDISNKFSINNLGQKITVKQLLGQTLFAKSYNVIINYKHLGKSFTQYR